MTKIINLSNLHEATAQEVFDQVAKHLLKQGKSSIGDTGCLYRSPDGLKCAAGCLIADDEYKPIMDSSRQMDAFYNIPTTGWKYLVRAGVVKSDNQQELISKLQSIHDQCHPSQWSNRLQDLAKSQTLEFKLEEYLA